MISTKFQCPPFLSNFQECAIHPDLQSHSTLYILFPHSVSHWVYTVCFFFFSSLALRILSCRARITSRSSGSSLTFPSLMNSSKYPIVILVGPAKSAMQPSERGCPLPQDEAEVSLRRESSDERVRREDERKNVYEGRIDVRCRKGRSTC